MAFLIVIFARCTSTHRQDTIVVYSSFTAARVIAPGLKIKNRGAMWCIGPKTQN